MQGVMFGFENDSTDCVHVMFKYLLGLKKDNCSLQAAVQQKLLLLPAHGAKSQTNQFCQQVNHHGIGLHFLQYNCCITAMCSSALLPQASSKMSLLEGPSLSATLKRKQALGKIFNVHSQLDGYSHVN